MSQEEVENISLMEVAARNVLHAKWTDEEMNALPRQSDESWIGLYQAFLFAFRLPLQFDKLVGECVEYEGLNKAAVVFANSLDGGSYTLTLRYMVRQFVAIS